MKLKYIESRRGDSRQGEGGDRSGRRINRSIEGGQG